MFGRPFVGALVLTLLSGGFSLAQDVLVRKVTNDAPGSMQCREASELPAGIGDVNNMPQGEVMVAVSPTGAIAATAKDYRYGPISSTIYNDHVWSGLYWSDNAGGDWRNLLYQNRTPYEGLKTGTKGAYGLPADEPMTITAESDPVVAFDGEGNLYSCALAFEPDAPEPDIFGMPAGFVVSRRGPDGRLAPGTTHFIGLETSPTAFGDKNWIAVDRTSPRAETAVVVTWRVFATEGSNVPEGAYLAVSGDGAETFSSPVRISLPPLEHSRSLTYQPLIGPDPVTGRKTLFVIFRINSRDGLQMNMHVAKAEIEGAIGTFALATRLTNPATWTHLPDRIAGIGRFGSNGYDGAFRFGSYFMPAMDQRSGNLYVVTHGFDRNRQASRVLVARSTDGGVTWTAPVTIDNPARGNQFMPSVAAAGGKVSVIWYDSRNDPAFAPLAIMKGIDVYYAELDEALVLERVLRLTPKTQTADHPVFTRTRPDPGSLDSMVQQEGYFRAVGDELSAVRSHQAGPEPYGFIGDYIGIAANDAFAFATWTDLRDLDASVDIRAGSACDGRRNQNIYFARIRK